MMKPRLRSIIFTSDMVRAILDSRKTVVRKVIKPQPKMKLCYTAMGSSNVGKWTYPSPTAHKYWGDEWRLADDITSEDRAKTWNPPCHTDDILYVREIWARHGNPKAGRPMHYDYKADRDDPRLWDNGFIAEWESPVRMPKEAARLFLKVTNVSVERLHDAPLESVLQEGIATQCASCAKRCQAPDLSVGKAKLDRLPCAVEFRNLWDSKVRKAVLKEYGWSADPYVWVIEFERCEKPEEM